MTTGIIYRPVARDEHGDPIDSDGNLIRLFGDDTVAKIGTIDGLIIGGTSGTTRSIQNAGVRGDVVVTDGMLGFPADSPIQLQAGDVVEAAGQRWSISGPVLWGWGPHSLTGNPAALSLDLGYGQLDLLTSVLERADVGDQQHRFRRVHGCDEPGHGSAVGPRLLVRWAARAKPTCQGDS